MLAIRIPEDRVPAAATPFGRTPRTFPCSMRRVIAPDAVLAMPPPALPVVPKTPKFWIVVSFAPAAMVSASAARPLAMASFGLATWLRMAAFQSAPTSPPDPIAAGRKATVPFALSYALPSIVVPAAVSGGNCVVGATSHQSLPFMAIAGTKRILLAPPSGSPPPPDVAVIALALAMNWRSEP